MHDIVQKDSITKKAYANVEMGNTQGKRSHRRC